MLRTVLKIDLLIFPPPDLQTSDGEAPAGEDQPQPGDPAAAAAGEHGRRGKRREKNKNKSGLCVIRLQIVNYERVARVTDVLHIFLIIIIRT